MSLAWSVNTHMLFGGSSAHQLWRWLTHIVVAVAAVGLPLPSDAQRTAPPNVREAVHRAVAAVAASLRMGLDPSAIEEMTASAGIFAGNFCTGQNDQAANARCEASLFRDPVLRRHVRDYLADAAGGPAEIKSLGARLAEEIGGSFAQIGWPSHVANQLGVVELPSELVPAEVSLATATGSVRIATSAERLLLSGGAHRLTVTPASGTAVMATVSVMPRRRVALNSSATPAAARTAGRLDPPAELFCYDRGGLKMDGPLAAFNWGRARLADTDTSYAAPISRTLAIDVRVEDRTGQCGSECKVALGVAFAQAISVWRTGCTVCDANVLAVLGVGDLIWIDTRIASRLRLIHSGTRVPLDLSQRRPEEFSRTVAAPSLSVPQTSIIGYEQVTADPFLRSTICKLTDAQANWVPSARHMACQSSGGGGAVSRPTLRILSGGTQCGSGQDFLACGVPNAGIEIAAGDTRFTLQGAHGLVAIGRSNDGLEVPLRDVIMHEVGHWFGVPHFDEIGVRDGADIMASMLGDGQACVSGASLTMMNNAMDLRWKWRVTEGRGLRRPRSAAAVAPPRAPPLPVAPPRTR